jgi:bis(5'-nucleosyl)-tetraphosphatase (symmetrical)
VNRGPRSLDVLRWARDQGDSVVAVLGNHDLHLLARAAGLAPAKRRDTLDEVLAAPDRRELIDWLRARPLLHVEDEWVMVHAGLHPQWTVARARGLASEIEVALRGPNWVEWLRQTLAAAPPWDDRLLGPARARSILSYLVRARTLDAAGANLGFDGPPDEAPVGAMPWYAVPPMAWRDHTVVYGHWSAQGLRFGERWIATDAGCVWGQRLTAVRLEDRAVTQVAAAEA